MPLTPPVAVKGKDLTFAQHRNLNTVASLFEGGGIIEGK